MQGLTLGLAIAAAVILLVGGSLSLFFIIFWKKMNTSGAHRIKEQFPTKQILRSESTANFFGLASRGRGQLRGNGVLALTPNELWFSRFVKREDINIPLQSITSVELVESHLGKRILGRALLYVEFQQEGKQDAIAWAVTSPTDWKLEIEQAAP